MIQMLRKEAVSGSIEDLGHIDTEHMLADPLTKSSVKPDLLIKCVTTGVIKNIDSSPEFRSALKHKAYLVSWLASAIPKSTKSAIRFLGEPISREVHAYYTMSSESFVDFVASEYARISSAGASSDADASAFAAETSDDHIPTWHAHQCSHCKCEYRHYHAGVTEHAHDDEHTCYNTSCAFFCGKHEDSSWGRVFGHVIQALQ